MAYYFIFYIDIAGIGIYSGLFYYNLISILQQSSDLLSTGFTDINFLGFAKPIISVFLNSICYLNHLFIFSVLGINIKLLVIIKIIIISLMLALTLYLIYIEPTDSIKEASANNTNYTLKGGIGNLPKPLRDAGTAVVGVIGLDSALNSIKNELKKPNATENTNQPDNLDLPEISKRLTELRKANQNSAAILSKQTENLKETLNSIMAEEKINLAPSMQKYIQNNRELVKNGEKLEVFFDEGSNILSELEKQKSNVPLGERIAQRAKFNNWFTECEDKVSKQTNFAKDNSKLGQELELKVKGLVSEDFTNNSSNNNKNNNNDIHCPLENERNFLEIIKDNVKERFSSLNGVLQFCLSIAFLNSIVISCVISIIFIIYGDYLIKKFSLEEKYPNLAKLISLRRKFQSYYLKINIILILFICLSQIVASIGVFSLFI